MQNKLKFYDFIEGFLKGWIILITLTLWLNLVRIEYFLYTHWGYGVNGVNSVTQEFLFQLKSPNPLIIFNLEFYYILTVWGIAIFVLYFINLK